MIAPLILAAAMAAAQAPASPSGAASTGAGMSPEPQAGGYAVNVGAVFVRRTPSLPGPVIDEEKAYVLFKVVSCQSGWCALDLGPKGGIGYLPSNILQAVPAPQ